MHYQVKNVVGYGAMSSGYTNYFKSLCWNRSTTLSITPTCTTQTV